MRRLGIAVAVPVHPHPQAARGVGLGEEGPARAVVVALDRKRRVLQARDEARQALRRALAARQRLRFDSLARFAASAMSTTRLSVKLSEGRTKPLVSLAMLCAICLG